MAREVVITVPPEITEDTIEKIKKLSGVIGIQLQPSASVKPPGDVITVDITNSRIHSLMHVLQENKIGVEAGTSIKTSEPLTSISKENNKQIVRDQSEALWEEMEIISGKESNITVNTVILMFASGFIAAYGIATNSIHIVIGAMIIAPGFVPLNRFSLGVISGSLSWKRGALDALVGYITLFAGALAATLIMLASEIDPLATTSGYLPKGSLVKYWSTITAQSIIISLIASFSGATVISANRFVLTSGIMIALALIPSAALSVMALTAGDTGLAGDAFLRFLIDVGLIISASIIVFFIKMKLIHKRTMNI